MIFASPYTIEDDVILARRVLRVTVPQLAEMVGLAFVKRGQISACESGPYPGLSCREADRVQRLAGILRKFMAGGVESVAPSLLHAVFRAPGGRPWSLLERIRSDSYIGLNEVDDLICEGRRRIAEREAVEQAMIRRHGPRSTSWSACSPSEATLSPHA